MAGVELCAMSKQKLVHRSVRDLLYRTLLSTDGLVLLPQGKADRRPDLFNSVRLLMRGSFHNERMIVSGARKPGGRIAQKLSRMSGQTLFQWSQPYLIFSLIRIQHEIIWQGTRLSRRHFDVARPMPDQRTARVESCYYSVSIGMKWAAGER